MSAETERVFSDTKLFISDLRSRLELKIIEALECIRKWILAGLYAATMRAEIGVISVSQRVYTVNPVYRQKELRQFKFWP